MNYESFYHYYHKGSGEFGVFTRIIAYEGNIALKYWDKGVVVNNMPRGLMNGDVLGLCLCLSRLQEKTRVTQYMVDQRTQRLLEGKESRASELAVEMDLWHYARDLVRNRNVVPVAIEPNNPTKLNKLLEGNAKKLVFSNARKALTPREFRLYLEKNFPDLPITARSVWEHKSGIRYSRIH